MPGHPKSYEYAMLDLMIRKLGPDSYIGPWLASIQDDIRWAISNDLPIATVLAKRDEILKAGRGV